MPGFDYGKMQATASRLLARFAQGTVTLTRTTYTPVSGEPWNNTTSTAVYDLDAAVSAVGAEFIDGTTIVATDRMVTCSVLPIEIEPGDVLTIDGVVVAIIKTIRTPAAGIAVAWKIIVRG